jgi:predicted small integral membrane protein
MTLRICQLLLTAGMALYLSLIVWNNLVDPASNLAYVRHVLAMDSLPRESPLRGRAIEWPVLQAAMYWTIVAWEAVAAILCWIGTGLQARYLRGDAACFAQIQPWAVAGLAASCLLWLMAFLAVAGEWFVMWQSPTFNAQDAAFRMFVVSGVVLLVVLKTDRSG